MLCVTGATPEQLRYIVVLKFNNTNFSEKKKKKKKKKNNGHMVTVQTKIKKITFVKQKPK